MRQIACPDRRSGVATSQCDTHQNLIFLHHALAVFFQIVRISAAIFGNPDIIQIQIQLFNVQVINTGISDSGKNPAQIRVGSEKRRFDQRRVCDGISDLTAFVFRLAFFNCDGNELGCALTVTDDFLGQFLSQIRNCRMPYS